MPSYLTLPKDVRIFEATGPNSSVLGRLGHISGGTRLLVDELEIMSYDHMDKLVFKVKEEPAFYILSEEVDYEAWELSVEWFQAYYDSVRGRKEELRIAGEPKEKELREKIAAIMRRHMRPALQVVETAEKSEEKGPLR